MVFNLKFYLLHMNRVFFIDSYLPKEGGFSNISLSCTAISPFIQATIVPYFAMSDFIVLCRKVDSICSNRNCRRVFQNGGKFIRLTEANSEFAEVIWFEVKGTVGNEIENPLRLE